MSKTIEIRRGSVYISADVYDTYFAGLEAVIILIRDDKLLILPVRQMAAGGCLLKVRNTQGDRVATAPDVFEAHGLSDFNFCGLPAQWSAQEGGLIAMIPANHSRSSQTERKHQ